MLAPASGAGGADDAAQQVQSVGELSATTLEDLFGLHGLAVRWVKNGEPIPGSYWGEREAGLVGDTLYLRADTPVHSALHEACHFICMDATRRAALHTDAKGDDIEEVGVCYLQALLAARLPGYSQARLFADMDACPSVAFFDELGRRGREPSAISPWPFKALSPGPAVENSSMETSSLDTVMRSVMASTMRRFSWNEYVSQEV